MKTTSAAACGHGTGTAGTRKHWRWLARSGLGLLAGGVALTMLAGAGARAWAACADNFAAEEIVLPFLCTDLNDYQPGAVVTIFGVGFGPGEAVELVVERADGTVIPDNPAYAPWLVAADASGNFVAQWQVGMDDCRDGLLRVVAIGLDSGLVADTVFSDAISPAISLASACGTYAQTFDSLVNAGASSTTPLGWGLAESGNNANTTYTASTGGNTAGDTYSYGAAGVNPGTDRAFGTLLSGSLTPVMGAAFLNNTGAEITALKISCVGEQWRLGTAGRADRLDFQINPNAATLTAAGFVDVNSLDFTTPLTSGNAGARDGNATAHRTWISAAITGLSIPNGQAFAIRWVDQDATGADDGLAIDDFTLTALAGGIAAQPVDLAACPGGSAAFGVGAPGAASFAWRKRGSGWGGGGWTINSGNGGQFVGNSTANNSGDPAANGDNDINSAGGKAWGLYNSGGATTEALRPFAAPIQVGETFSIDLDNGNIAAGGTVGFGLQNAATGNRLEVFFRTGDSYYTVSDNAGQVNNTGIGFTRSGINVRFTLVSSDTYALVIRRYRDNATASFSGTLRGPAGAAIDRLRLFNSSAGSGSGCDFFFNNISLGAVDDNAANPPYAPGWGTGDDGGQRPLANGGSIAGADTANLTISPVGAAHAGAYDVVVGGCQETISRAAALTIQADTTPPAITACPADQPAAAGAGCMASVPDFAAATAASDDCTPADQLVKTQHPAAGTLVGPGVTEVTVVVTDAAGNQSSACRPKFTVNDTVPPTIDCPVFPPLPAGANGLAVVPEMVNLADSALDFGTQGAGNWFYGTYFAFEGNEFYPMPFFDGAVWRGYGCYGTPYLHAQGGHPGVGGCDAFSGLQWAVRRYVAEASGTFMVKGVFSDDLENNCGDGVNLRIRKNTVNLDFNVMGTGPVAYWHINPGDGERQFNLVVTLAAGDDLDFCIDPCFDWSCDFTRFNVNIRPLVVDECGVALPPAAPPMTQNPAAGTLIAEPTEVTLTATDNAGNPGSCTTRLLIKDALPPVARCRDITRALAGAAVTVTAAEMDNGSTDNRGAVTLALRRGAATAFGPAVTFDCADVGAQPVEVQVTDLAGNTATCQALVTVQDQAPPQMTAPPDLTVQSRDRVPAADFAGGTATDNCGAPEIAWARDDESHPGTSCGNVITRTYRATDPAGNAAVCTQVITLDDTTPPTITCPPDVEVECGAPRDPGHTGTAMATDNSDGNVAVNHVDSAVTPAANVTLVAWNFPHSPDDAVADGGVPGNSAKTIATTGGTGPVTFDVSGATTMSASTTAWDDGIGTKAWLVSLATTGYRDLKVFSKQRSSNTGPRDFKLQFSLDGAAWDDVAAVPAVANSFAGGTLAGVPLPAEANHRACVYLRWVMTSPAAVNGGAVANGGSSRMDDIVVTGDGNGADLIARTWTATDACGNQATCAQRITVRDTTAPVLTGVPADLAVPCQDEVPPADPRAVIATDACDPGVSVSVSDSDAGDNCMRVITRTWTARDNHGNTAQASQRITVADTTPPAVAPPPDVTVEYPAATSPAELGTASAGDACDVLVAYKVNLADVSLAGFSGAGFAPDPGPGQLDSDEWSTSGWSDGAVPFGGTGDNGTDFGRGTSGGDVLTGGIYAFNVGDGNMALGIQPSTGNFVPGDLIFRKIDNPTAQAITVLDVTYTIYVRNNEARSSSFNFSHSPDGVTFTDERALDFTSPAAADVPAAWAAHPRRITLRGLSIPPGGTYYLRWTSADVAGTDARDELALDDILVTSGPSRLEYSDAETPGCGNTRTIVRTWRVGDACGNIGSAQQTIRVVDTTAPAVTAMPPDRQVECRDDVPVPDPSLVTATDTGGAVTVTHVADVSDGRANPETITRTYRATDACGNSVDAAQVITVKDTLPPTVSGPASQTVAANGNCQATVPNLVPAAQAADNCTPAAELVLAQDPPAGALLGLGSWPVRVTATDRAGNRGAWTCALVVQAAPPGTAEYAADPQTMLLCHFNEGRGTVTLNSANNRNCQVRGAAWATGLVAGASLRFDGGVTKGYYTQVDAGPLSVLGSMTVEAVIEPQVVSGTHAIVDNLYNMALWIERGILKFGVFHRMNYITPTVVASQVLQPGRRVHVAAVYNHATGRHTLYINGQPVGSAVQKINDGYWLASPVPLRIGQGYRVGDMVPQFIGRIDEVRISRTARDLSGCGP